MNKSDFSWEAKYLFEYLVKKLKLIYNTNESESLAKYVLKEIFNLSVLDIISNKSLLLSPTQKDTLGSVLERLKNQEPIQYIFNQAEFLGKLFYVNSHVLIPRPETEELVYLVVEELKNFSNPRVLDLGTGSGCIPIGIKILAPNSNVYALDISLEALLIAKNNAKSLNAEVIFFQDNILEPQILQDEMFDILVSNPPYIPQNERNQIQKNVKDFEPSLALFVPDENPLLHYEAIAQKWLRFLKPNGVLFFEIHHLMAMPIKEMLQNQGLAVEIHKDFHVKNRFVKAKRVESIVKKVIITKSFFIKS